MARASARCALSSACADLVYGRIDLLSWLFVVMCGMLEFAGKGHNLNHAIRRGKRPRAGKEVPIFG